MWQTYAPNKKFYGSQECLGPEDTKQMLLKNPGRKSECRYMELIRFFLPPSQSFLPELPGDFHLCLKRPQETWSSFQQCWCSCCWMTLETRIFFALSVETH
ncbi:unnamed protein product [Nippostrongylus brasiliensis]|uniref:Ovule protein n=1 Tax=Nippostrongylus brasiliensis TaxID=27835 RepID=A0A0N4XF54_NIPBR|nr:unnamed protein product [Nippostrongylus brasiliensis]